MLKLNLRLLEQLWWDVIFNLCLFCIILSSIVVELGHEHVFFYLYADSKYLCCIQAILPLTTNIPEAYANGSSEEQVDLSSLSIFVLKLVQHLSS